MTEIFLKVLKEEYKLGFRLKGHFISKNRIRNPFSIIQVPLGLTYLDPTPGANHPVKVKKTTKGSTRGKNDRTYFLTCILSSLFHKLQNPVDI